MFVNELPTVSAFNDFPFNLNIYSFILMSYILHGIFCNKLYIKKIISFAANVMIWADIKIEQKLIQSTIAQPSSLDLLAEVFRSFLPI